MRLQRRLTPFVDPLPIPGVLKPVARKPHFTFYVVRMMETFQKLHRDLPPTRIWGYEGNIRDRPSKCGGTNRSGCFG